MNEILKGPASAVVLIIITTIVMAAWCIVTIYAIASGALKGWPLATVLAAMAFLAGIELLISNSLVRKELDI